MQPFLSSAVVVVCLFVCFLLLFFVVVFFLGGGEGGSKSTVTKFFPEYHQCPGQPLHSVWPDLGSDCFLRLSADDTNRQWAMQVQFRYSNGGKCVNYVFSIEKQV